MAKLRQDQVKKIVNARRAWRDANHAAPVDASDVKGKRQRLARANATFEAVMRNASDAEKKAAWKIDL